MPTTLIYGHGGDAGQTTAGTYSWTPPSSGTVEVRAYGGGGGGGYKTANANAGGPGGDSGLKDGGTWLCRAGGGKQGDGDQAFTGNGGTALVGTGNTGGQATSAGGGGAGPTSAGCCCG